MDLTIDPRANQYVKTVGSQVALVTWESYFRIKLGRNIGVVRGKKRGVTEEGDRILKEEQGNTLGSIILRQT